MALCPKCGAELPEGAQFCRECGEAIAQSEAFNAPAAPNAAPAPQPQYQASAPQSAPAPQYAAPAPAAAPQYRANASAPAYQQSYAVAQSPASRTPEMTWGKFFWTRVLFSIPLVGFIFMLIWSFGGSSNRTRVQYARSYLIPGAILFGIGLVIFIILLIIAAANGESISRYIDEITRSLK